MSASSIPSPSEQDRDRMGGLRRHSASLDRIELGILRIYWLIQVILEILYAGRPHKESRPYARPLALNRISTTNSGGPYSWRL